MVPGQTAPAGLCKKSEMSVNSLICHGNDGVFLLCCRISIIQANPFAGEYNRNATKGFS